MQPFQTEFFELVVPAARATMAALGIPASITIAQATLESGWGKTRLASEFNNFFGIKASQEQIADHDYCEFNTQEEVNHSLESIKARFAQYATPTECFIAHGVLLSRPHYAAAMACKNNPDAFAWALGPKTALHPEGCGYSTLSAYHDRLMLLVMEYNLSQYDALAQVKTA
jgi:flagellum-specific peptidoglycan hydrolase FlgJ